MRSIGSSKPEVATNSVSKRSDIEGGATWLQYPLKFSTFVLRRDVWHVNGMLDPERSWLSRSDLASDKACKCIGNIPVPTLHGAARQNRHVFDRQKQ